MTRRHVSVLATVAALCVAWMNPTRDRIAAANLLFEQGHYEEALTKYGEALVDDPDSPLLNFNMGDANYKAGKYDEALASFARVEPDTANPRRLANAAYNAGNVQYRLGAAAEASKPQDALKAYAGALVAYRHALGADPTDRDAKVNYEFVSKKIDDLKKKLEAQQQQQQQQQQKQDQQQDQQKDQPPQDQPPQDQQQGDQQQKPDRQEQQKPDQEKQAQQEQAQQDKADKPPEKQDEQQQAGEPQPADQQPDAAKQGGAAGAETGEKTDQMSPQEAAAIIDTAKNDELQPEEFARKVQGGVVAEPAQDW